MYGMSNDGKHWRDYRSAESIDCLYTLKVCGIYQWEMYIPRERREINERQQRRLMERWMQSYDESTTW